MWCYRRYRRIQTEGKMNPYDGGSSASFRHVARGSAGELGATILEGKLKGRDPEATWADNIKDWTGLSIYSGHTIATTGRALPMAATHPLSDDGTGCNVAAQLMPGFVHLNFYFPTFTVLWAG